MRCALAVVLSLLASICCAFEFGGYLRQLLEQSPYRAAWNTLMTSSGRIPRWAADYPITNNGVDFPSKFLDIGGRKYVFARMCKPRACTQSEIDVVFTAGGLHAYALLVEQGEPRWIGNPPDEARAIVLDERGW